MQFGWLQGPVKRARYQQFHFARFTKLHKQLRIPIQCVVLIVVFGPSLPLTFAALGSLRTMSSMSTSASSFGDSDSENQTYDKLTASLLDIPFPKSWQGSLPSQLEADHRSLDEDRLEDDDEHPIYNPEKEKCHYCGMKGHSILFCPDRLRAAEKLRIRFCTRGYHLPHLHDNLDIWRCQWCSMHLKTAYVWKWYPTVAAEEYEKQAKRLAGIYRKHC